MRISEGSGQELLGRVRAGDEHAFEALFRTHYPGLLRFACAHLGSESEAEDAVHDVFLRLWSEPGHLAAARSARTYLLAAVRNRVIDLLRRRRVERRWLDPFSAFDSGDGDRVPPAEIPDPAAQGDAAGLAELDQAIRSAIADLPERCRTALLLCREADLSYAEAAEVMGVTPATVKTQMARALAALRIALHPFLALLAAVAPLLR